MVKQTSNIEIEGTVVESLPNTMFRVKAEDDRVILCHLSGKMRMYRIKVMPGDRVKIEMTPHDNFRGRIVFRQG